MSRNIINISLPPKMADKIRREAKSGGFASVSEYMRHILREHAEKEKLYVIRDSQAEIKAGKGKTLRSLKDLR